MKFFIDNLTSYLNKLKHKKVFICGDYNIDLVKADTDYDTAKFLELMFSYGHYPLIRLPTRIQENSCTVIDNIFTNITEFDLKSNVLIDDITDHLPVLCMYKHDNIQCITGSEVIKRRNIKEDNLSSLINVLNSVEWNKVVDISDVNTAYKVFSEKLVSCFDRCCPLTEVKVRKRNHKPWLTKGLINACHKKKIYTNANCKQRLVKTRVDI